ncbi:MAG TPA: GIDE domain-containing protein [Herpetosiphonaceae bacterium]
MQVRQIPVLPLDRVPDAGNIAIIGQTQPAQDPEYAPLSNTPCVYWRIVLREQEGRRSLTTLSDRTSGHPFRLSDGEHGIWIEPAHATLSLTGPGHHTWLMNDLVALEQLAREGAVARRWQKTTWTYVSEVCIPVGEKVWVYGAVSTAKTGKIIAGDATKPILISNRSPRQLIWLYGSQWMVASVVLLVVFLATIFLLWWVYQGL